MIQTTKQDIRDWYGWGEELSSTHMLIVCDEFSHEDYPVFVTESQNVLDVINEYDHKNMQHVHEVYTYAAPINEQLAQEHAWNL